MRVAALAILLLSACEERGTYEHSEVELADSNCKPYLAVPGEPCREGHWLYVDGLSNFPRPALCSCDTKPVMSGHTDDKQSKSLLQRILDPVQRAAMTAEAIETVKESMTVKKALDQAATQAEPPDYCPCCHDAAKSPAKDEKGRWTWDCKEGCNP